MTEQFIVFDTEYASWQGFLDAPEEEKKKAEIVQIAALKIQFPRFKRGGKTQPLR